MKKYLSIIVASALVMCTSITSAQVYLDPSKTVDERVEDLLSRMTLEEKVGQTAQAERQAFTDITDVRTYFIGSILSGGGSVPPSNTGTGWADMYDGFQRQALATRLKIPIIYGVDAVHGHNNVKDAVIFPHNIGLGSTRNPELVKRVAEVTATEIKGTGVNWTFAPCIAVTRDERWGRTYEGFGETPELVTEMGVASVKGLQGETYQGKSSILACAKHYMGDGGTTGGVDQGNTQVDELTLRRLHLPAYIEAIKAGVGSIMASYSSWNGQKLHGHKYLLTDVLKNELGFQGFVVSDWAGIDQLPGTYAEKVETSINAGIDMVMLPNNYKEYTSTLRTLVLQGKVTQARLDDAVRRILRIKFQGGLFEFPMTDRTFTSQIGSDDHRQVARQAVRESLVLLKKKDNVLPLLKDNMKIHVAGKNANDIGNQCGGWTIYWQGGSGNITKGTTVLGAIQKAVNTSIVTTSSDGSGATGSDIAVAVIGETPYAEGAGDRAYLNLTPEDIATVRNLKEKGIPVITILISGRPMILDPILPFSDAIIAAWLPGTEGDGIADVLFGDFQPKGVLSNSWPRNMAQVPINFGDANYNPLFEYGFGITSLDNSPAGSAPEFSSSVVSGDGNSLEVSFNKPIDNQSVASTGFTVTVNSMNAEITGASIKSTDNTTIILNLSSAIKKGDVVSISYTPGTIQSTDNGVLASFTSKSVYNIIDENMAFDIPGRIEAENYFRMSGVEKENTTDTGGGVNVGWIDNSDWMDYMLNIPTTGTYKIDFRVASLSTGGKITVKLADTIIGAVTLPITYGWQNWTTVSMTTRLTKGSKTLRVHATVGGFNLNWFEIDNALAIGDEPEKSGFMLGQNFPNPFNRVTNIRYSIPASSNVRLSIHDMLGREVMVLVNETQSPGEYTIELDAEKFNLHKGTYIYRLQAGDFYSTRKLMIY